MVFKDKFDAMQVAEGQLCITWIGQAGFLIKTSNMTIGIDPYLTDSVYNLFKSEHGLGFKRMTPALFEPRDIVLDALFSSHEHGDHMDADAIFELMDNAKTRLYANSESAAIALEKGVPPSKVVSIEKGSRVQFEGLNVYALPADHGELSPNAMGFLFDFGFSKVYYSGDTSYNKKVLKKVIEMKADIALLPINGAFGNLDAKEAALLAQDVSAKICIPHHFWTFPLHLGNPQQAIELFPKLAPSCKLLLQTPGEMLMFPD